MYYQFLPFDQQIDGGYGLIADAFKDAATKMSDNEIIPVFLNNHFPIYFLYRHSIELYLKSSIIVIHRTLKLSCDEKPFDSVPSIMVDGKWKPIERTHSLRQLYSHFRWLIDKFGQEISSRGETDWTRIPPELDQAIEKIENADSSSTYFRYPMPPGVYYTDNDKSSWQKTNTDEIIESADADRSKMKVFAFTEADGTMESLYRYIGTPLPEIKDALSCAASLLSGANYGLRSDLAGGL